jgi:hypothetical protein
VPAGDDETGKKNAGGRKRPGLPSKESVISEKTFVSPAGKRYRIIRTKEKDPYDKPEEPDGKDQ